MFVLFNLDTNLTKTSANITHTNTQKKRHQKSLYKALSEDKNTKKNEKSEENNKNKQNSQTASESCDFSHNVDTSPNANSNNSNKTQEEATSTSTVNKIDISDANQTVSSN